MNIEKPIKERKEGSNIKMGPSIRVMMLNMIKKSIIIRIKIVFQKLPQRKENCS